jgi:FKBP-type peptidyl-prolyl cis-trans isomerase FkpA
MHRPFAALLTLSLSASPVFAAVAKPAATSRSDDESTAYAYGYKIGQNLAQLGLSDVEVKSLAQGLKVAAAGKDSEVNMAVYLPKVQQLIEAHVAARAGIEKKKGKEYSDAFAKEAGVSELPGGGWIKTLTAGTGATPATTDTVKVHYKGTLTNGTEFDSSYKRGEPATFPLNGVIPCWTNGVAKMKVAGKAKLVCPSDVAYGDQGHPPTIPGGSTLVFEVELLEIVKADAPAPKPAVKK